MEEIKCEYCDSSFRTRSSLTYHQKTARYCVILRPDYEPKKYTCNSCDKVFILKDSMNRHRLLCGASEKTNEQQNEIANKDAQIARLQILIETKDEIIKNQKGQIENMMDILNMLKQKIREDDEFSEGNSGYCYVAQSTENIQSEIMIDKNSIMQIASEMICDGEANTTLDFVNTFMFALDSKEQFPLDIELLVDRRVFKTGGNARRILSAHFIKDVDYKIVRQNRPIFTSIVCVDKDQNDDFVFQVEDEEDCTQTLNITTDNKIVQNEFTCQRYEQEEIIKLTPECFKSLSQAAMNEAGRQTRLCYQDMEKIYKKYISIEQNKRFNNQNSEIKRMNRNHNAILKRRTYFQFKTGPCMYLLSFSGKHKFGFSDDMNKVLPSERRMAPSLRVEYLVYSPMARRLEQNMLLKHTLNLETPNHEIVINFTTEKLIESTRNMIEALNLEHQEENNISEYNYSGQT
jgi:hypothetical protein